MGAVGGPLKNGKGPRTELAFGAIVFFEHLDVRIFGKAGFADAGEVGGFPARAIQILFYLGRHDGGEVCGVIESGGRM